MRNEHGFTLIELMITVVIVSILASIALPSYQSYILKSHRTAAIGAIMELAGREARYYTINNSYTASMVALGYSADPMPVTGGSSTTYYNLSVQSASPSTTFSLQAVPVGNQLNDSCGTYIYGYLGVKGISSGTLSDCWKQ